jgi:hypothetical protein
MFDLLEMDRREKRKEIKVTVLHRPGGVWRPNEFALLGERLRTEARYRPEEHPEHIVLWGHFTKAQTLEVLGGGTAYTATQVTGIDDPRVPFPCFV